MSLTVPILIIAIILFVLAATPLARGWMIPIGLALVACAMLPYFHLTLIGR